MRELSEQEKLFIEQTLNSRADLELVEVEPTKIELQKVVKVKPKEKKKHFWNKMIFWAGFVMMIPTVFTMFFIYGIMRAQSIIGDDALNWLSSQKLTPEMKKTAEESGYGWLPQLANLYSHRFVIIAGAFSIGLIIVIIMMLIDAFVINRKEDEDAETD